MTTSQDSDRELFSSFADRARGESAAADGTRVTLLIADALACSRSAPLVPFPAFVDDGVAGVAALLALRMSSRDLDDVDWSSLHHPGSVVLPVVLALSGRGHRAAGSVVRAVCSGYRVAATMADLLGVEHRRRWHVTATAGAIGAASAASVLLGATPEQHADALALAAANVGGVGQAPLERLGAASFNRAAAATLGLLAARAAIAGAQPTTAALTGPRGLVALTSPDNPLVGNVHLVPVREGLSDAHVRLFPVTGFAHSAVLATTALRARAAAPLVSLEVMATPAAAELADGSAGGDWWNLPLAVARAWELGDPFAVDDPVAGSATVGKVTVTSSSSLASGQARVVAITGAGPLDSGVVDAPRIDDGVTALLERKWSVVLGQDPERILDTARTVTSSGLIDLESLVG